MGRVLSPMIAGEERAVDPLLAAIRRCGAQPWDTASLAVTLGMVGEPAVVPLIEALLHDPAPHVRAAAAQALVWPKDRRALAPLQAALEDSDENVRLQATWSLQQLSAQL